MAQRDLFGDETENRRLEVQDQLQRELRQQARHYGDGRPTIYIERLELGPSGALTAAAWLNGRRYAVVNRADVVSAARDLWEQANPAGGTR
jgi:hypothetical protein